MSSVSNSHSDLAGAGRPKLKRSLGLWMATALVIGNMVDAWSAKLAAARSEKSWPRISLATFN